MNEIGYSNLIYDYIIIGTGPAGAIMAKLLSDNPDISVLVLEAGDNDTEELPIRMSANEIYQYWPNYFWQGRTVAQKNANNRLFNWSTGRTLGGGSSVNGEQYVRPTHQYFRRWEKYAGSAWSPEQADMFFASMENYNGNAYSNIHGYGGPVDIRQAPVSVPAAAQKLVSAISFVTDYPVILDYNDPATPIGPFYQWQLYQKPDGQRSSAATAFLSPDIITPEGTGVNGRRLTVLMRATALRILINDNREAYGVEFLQDGCSMIAYANRKIVISAGINSSQLLLLSGVGPEELLNRINVPVIFNNPGIGNHLVNHTINTAQFSINQADLDEALSEPLSLYTGGAFLPSPDYSAATHRDIQLVGQIDNGRLTLMIIDLDPQSRGMIIPQNDDPLKIVLSDYGYLSNTEDLMKMKRVFRYMIIPIAEALQQIDPSYRLLSPSYDACYDDAKLEEYIRENVFYAYHAQCFNRMAPFAEGGVVDQSGNVYGVSHLAVADTSILPFPVDCNTSSAAYFIGYTMANLLLQEELAQ